MKKQQTWMAAVLVGLALTSGVARATIYSYDFEDGFTGGTTVADGNPAGWTDSRSISDIVGGDQISGLTVHLNLSGGYNGDLYGYLVLMDTTTHAVLGTSMLLNRVGTGSGSEPQFSFGYADAGLNVALSDTGANGDIHDYQTANGGDYTGLISGGGAFETDGGSLAAFNGASANNTWTLFLADMSTGSTTMVTSWGLEIAVVPEPVTWAVLIFGAFMAGVEAKRRGQISKGGTSRQT